ncbi:MAG: hypothetical protein JW987_05830 [Anaerolineaceae bacterium]|nr:hypothetical protein [Anaerolineaceae bacterium]
MKKYALVLFIVSLAILSLACSLGGGGKETPAPGETEEPSGPGKAAVEATAPASSTQEATSVPEAPEISPTEALLPEPAGMQPGWYALTNANVVRDLVIHDGVIYAATLGGMISWRLDSGYSMHYTPLDGMGNVSANAITYCEIPEPRILVGTLTGISVYDPNTGLWEEEISFPAESRIAESKIEQLYCDQVNQRLLIGYYGLGAYDLQTGAFERYTMDQGLLWNTVSDIAVDGKDIWVASGYKGIAKISGGKVTTFSAAEGIPDEKANALALAPDGTLWIGASGGLISYRNGQWVSYDADSPANLKDIRELEIGADGKIWVATYPWGAGRLCQLDAEEAVCTVDITESNDQGINSLALTESGSPVFGTNLGVSRVENGQVMDFRTDDALASNYVDSFAIAPDGKLWIGTDGGIHLIDPTDPGSPWQTFKQSEIPDMGGSWGKAIAVAPDGAVWFTATNGSASRYQDGVWTMFKDIYSFDAVAVDVEGRAWFGEDSKGVVVLNPDGTQAFALTTNEGLPGDNVQAIVVDGAGIVWIGTNEGLAKYENDALMVVFDKDTKEIPNKYIRALTLDANGVLMIGTFTGVARYDGSQVEVLVDFAKDGFSEIRLTTLSVAPDGSVWAGTDKGLLTDANGAWKLYTTKDGLNTNYISALQVDLQGKVWVGGGGSNYDGGGIVYIVP